MAEDAFITQSPDMGPAASRVGATLLVLCALAGCGRATDTAREPVRSLPAPASGSHWVSWRDVAVQVPDSWDFGREPREDWCADGVTKRLPRKPYVVLDPTYGPILSIGCMTTGEQHPPAFGPAPEAYWATHVALESADGGPDISLTHEGWSLTSRTVGDVRVRVLSTDATEAAAMLATATRFEVDQNGCEPSSPIQASDFVRPEPFDVMDIGDVESVSVCQYERGIPLDEPALMASRTMLGDDAADLLRGLQTAPSGGGPDKPDQCSEDSLGETGVALHLTHAQGSDTVFVYSDTCRGNGTDDGTVKRELTADTCAPLFEPPVVAWSFSTSLLGLCG